MPKNAPTKYYQLTQTEDTAELYIFGDICSWPWKEFGEKSGWNIVEELQSITADNVQVHINSYGGEVAEGLAIYNVLKNSGKNITTICDGFACSAASVVFMAGSKRIMNAASLLMIHNAWAGVYGNASELRKAADDIEKITQASVEAYKLRCNISEEKIKELMDDESWILPVDAVEMGFATEIMEVENTGAQQSAFGIIMRELTAPALHVNVDGERLATAVAEKIVAKLKPTIPNSWNDYFETKEN